jgi:DNA-binding CsgD family transcriptional regulator
MTRVIDTGDVAESPDAGTAALAAGRWAEARAAFDRELAMSESREALSGMAKALWWLGDMPGSVAFHQRAYAASRRAGDTTSAALAAVELSITYAANFADLAAASGWARRAETLLGPDPGPELGAWLHLARGYATSNTHRALDERTRALELARRSGDADLELCSLTAVGEALVMTGRVSDGLALVDEAMAATLAGEPQRLDTVAYTCCDMMVSCSLAGDLERAVRWCRHADTFIDRYGCPFLYARCRISYGTLLMVSGDWVESEAQLTAAVRMAASGGRSVRAEAIAALAALRTRQGRVAEARALLAEAKTDQATAGALAAVQLAEGRPAMAVAVLERRLRHGDGSWHDTAELLVLLVDGHCATGDLGAARAASDRLAILARSAEHDLPRALAASAQARVHIAEGDPDAAVLHLEEATGLFDRLDRPWELARVRLCLAQVLAGTRPEVAAAEAHAALETLEALGAAAEADATAAFLRTLGVHGRRQPRSHALLTRREQCVLDLLGQGLSNREIAHRLYISPKTAAHHVSAVLAKLGVRRRAEAVALAARQPAQSATVQTVSGDTTSA